MRNDDSSTETESESDTEEEILSEFNESIEAIEQEFDKTEVLEEVKDKKVSNEEKIEALK